MGCTLATPEEYNWTIRVRRRCGLTSNYFDHLLLLLLTVSHWATLSHPTIYTRIQVKKFGTVLPPQNLSFRGQILYAGVTVCQHTCHEFLHKADDVSWARDWRTLRPVARQSAVVGHWHVTLVCVTAARWTGGWERSTVRSVLQYCRQITDMGMADTWLTSEVVYGVILAVLDVGARRRVAPCCDQLLILSQNTWTIRAARSRGTLSMASATSLTRWYTRYTYTRVLNFGHFFDRQEEGSTYMRINLYAHTYTVSPSDPVSVTKNVTGVTNCCVCTK